MDYNYDEIIKDFRQKIKTIVNLYEAEKEKNKELTLNNLKLEEKLSRNNKDYKTLQTRYNNLKLAKTLTASAKDAHDAKMKVNGLVREIDKCIALLNK